MVTPSEVWNYLNEVFDPEIPVLTIHDLGVVRDIAFKDNQWQITITPTYSGCPAMQVIEDDIISKLKEHGIENVNVTLVLSPAWTTDWITANGKEKLLSYGIAPPQDEPDKSVLFADPVKVPCPRCKSTNTRMVSLFGSTACKAQYQCNECLEPYDYFKCLK